MSRLQLFVFIALFVSAVVFWVVMFAIALSPARANSPRDVICKADPKPVCVYRKKGRAHGRK